MGLARPFSPPPKAHEIHPLLQFDDVDVIGYDSQAGYADPYLTTTAYARRAKELGVDVRTDTAVTGLHLNGDVKTITTTNGAFAAPVRHHGRRAVDP